MDKKLTARLQDIATKMLDEVEERPIKSIIMALIVVWIIRRIIKSI